MKKIFLYFTTWLNPTGKKKALIVEDIRVLGRTIIAGGLLSVFATNISGLLWLIIVLLGCIIWLYGFYLSEV